MDTSGPLLGVTATKYITETQTTVILTCGSDRLTRADFAGVQCFNFMAVRNLNDALQGVGVKNLRELFERVSPIDFAIPHVGVIALAALGAAFEAAGVGGSTPLANWAKKHANGSPLRTFDTIKAHRAAPQVRGRSRRRHTAVKKGSSS